MESVTTKIEREEKTSRATADGVPANAAAPQWCIVVGGDHHNTLSIVRSLGAAKIRVALVIVSGDGHSFVARSRYATKTCIVPDETRIERAVFELSAELPDLRARRVPVICTSDGAAAAVDASARLHEAFLCPGTREDPPGTLIECMGKFSMSRLAHNAGFCVPATFLLPPRARDGAVPAIPAGLEFPCILKPEKSFLGSKEDFRICRERAQWQETLESVSAEECFVCQPFLRVDAEGQVLGVRRADGKCFFAGTTHKPLCCPETRNLGMTVIAEFSPEAFRYCSRDALEALLEKSGYFGPFSAEFIVSEGKTYFVEINFRTDGNFYLSLAGGVNLPAIWCGDSDAKNFTAKPALGLVEISYLKYVALKHPLRIIPDFLRATAFAIFSWRDPKPFFFKIFNFIMSCTRHLTPPLRENIGISVDFNAFTFRTSAFPPLRRISTEQCVPAHCANAADFRLHLLGGQRRAA